MCGGHTTMLTFKLMFTQEQNPARRQKNTWKDVDDNGILSLGSDESDASDEDSDSDNEEDN